MDTRFVVLGIVMIVGASFLLPIGIRSLATMGRSSQVMDHGQAALFKVVSVKETNIRINYNPLLDFVLEVHPLNEGSVYKLKKRLVVSILHIPRIQTGSVIPGKYDPQDPSQVAFDFNRELTDSENKLTGSFSQQGSDSELKVIEGNSSKGVTVFVLSLLGFILGLTFGILLTVWGFVHSSFVR